MTPFVLHFTVGSVTSSFNFSPYLTIGVLLGDDGLNSLSGVTVSACLERVHLWKQTAINERLDYVPTLHRIIDFLTIVQAEVGSDSVVTVTTDQGSVS